MKHKAVKVGLTTLVVVLSFGGLLYSPTRRRHRVYKHVDEVMGQPDSWYGKKLQLHGYVVQNSNLEAAQQPRLSTSRSSNGINVTASYTGVVPDTFKSDAEVVLKGTLSAEGFQGLAERRHGEVPVQIRSQARSGQALR